MRRTPARAASQRKPPGPEPLDWKGFVRRLVFLGVVAVIGSVIFLLAVWNRETVDDPALGMPASGKADFRFHALAPWASAVVPLARGFESPVGSQNGALSYNAQPYWILNLRHGGHHTGDDLNGIGGMNTDLGDPVFAAADGLVLYAANPSPGWGNVVILAHRLEDGRRITTMYAHLHSFCVKPGDLIARGKQIGLIGTADGRYPAHLHFEMRESDGADIGSGYAMFPLNHIDPARFIRENPANPPDRPAPSILGVALAVENTISKP